MGTDVLLPLVVLGLLSCLAVGAADFISRNADSLSAGAMEGHNNILSMQSRHLLQATQNCPINFQTQNYTILTSQCKGPSYPKTECCNAFFQFACPFAKELNDLTNDCATSMFSYININGHYPIGLFANECTNGTSQGLLCPAASPTEVQS